MVTGEAGTIPASSVMPGMLIRGYDTMRNRPCWGTVVKVSEVSLGNGIRINTVTTGTIILPAMTGIFSSEGVKPVGMRPRTAIGPCAMNPRQRTVRQITYFDDLRDCETIEFTIISNNNIDVKGLLLCQ